MKCRLKVETFRNNECRYLNGSSPGTTIIISIIILIYYFNIEIMTVFYARIWILTRGGLYLVKNVKV